MTNNLIQGELLFSDSIQRKAETPTSLRGNERYSELRKKKTDNLHLLKYVKCASTGYNFPVVQPYQGLIPSGITPFNALHKKEYDRCVHFFLHDYIFSCIWSKLEVYTKKLSFFRYVLSPDYSIYVDTSMAYNIQNIYKQRFVTSYWQACGLNVIPVLSWGDANSLTYCLEGLPQDSVLAIGTVGVSSSSSSLRLWRYMLKESVKRLHPIALMVYGQKIDAEYGNIPVYFYQDFITTKFNNYGRTKAI